MDSLPINQTSISSHENGIIQTTLQKNNTFPPNGSSDQNPSLSDGRYDRKLMTQNLSYISHTPNKDSVHHQYLTPDQSDRTESIQNTPMGGYTFLSPPPSFSNSYMQGNTEFENDGTKKNNLNGLNEKHRKYLHDSQNQKEFTNVPQNYESQFPPQYHGYIHPNTNPEYQHYQNQQYLFYQQQYQQQQKYEGQKRQEQTPEKPKSSRKKAKRPKSPQSESSKSSEKAKDVQSDEPSIRKRKKRLLKKAPNAPKRGKSAYICYSIAKRPEIQAELGPNAKATDVVVRIASTWRDLPEQEKKAWEQKAKADKRRYEHEIQEYDGPMKIPNKRVKKNPDAPKRGMSAFLLYSQVMRSQLKKLHPNLKNTEISRMLGEHWNELALENKQPYVDQANEENQKYLDEMDKYKQGLSESGASPTSTPKKGSKSNQSYLSMGSMSANKNHFSDNNSPMNAKYERS